MLRLGYDLGFGEGERIFRRHDAELGPLVVDDADLSNSDLIVDAQRSSYGKSFESWGGVPPTAPEPGLAGSPSRRLVWSESVYHGEGLEKKKVAMPRHSTLGNLPAVPEVRPGCREGIR